MRRQVECSCRFVGSTVEKFSSILGNTPVWRRLRPRAINPASSRWRGTFLGIAPWGSSNILNKGANFSGSQWYKKMHAPLTTTWYLVARVHIATKWDTRSCLSWVDRHYRRKIVKPPRHIATNTHLSKVKRRLWRQRLLRLRRTPVPPSYTRHCTRHWKQIRCDYLTYTYATIEC